jgi:subtilisin family serine protease
MHVNRKHPRALAIASVMLFVAFGGVATAPTPASDRGLIWSVIEGGPAGAPIGSRPSMSAVRTDLHPRSLARAGEIRIGRSPFERRGDAVRVAVELDSARAGEISELIHAHGGRVELAAERLLQAWVPASGLEALREHDDVRGVRRPARFQPLGVPGEGVAATNASAWQAVGLTGAGVKVAIFDGGFAGLAERQAAGDIPSSVITVDYCGGGFAGPESHGTAVAEIVAEVAPSAQLHLVCIDTDVALAQAVGYAKANGIQIVNLSGGFLNTWRGDGNGPPGTPDAVVSDARANGILWVNAAGNEAESHWGGMFVSADGDPFLEFAPGDEANSVLVPPGNVLCGFLRWDNWPVASDDYDLGLYDFELGRFVAVSDADQIGDRLPPTEELCVQNLSGSVRHAGFAVARYAGTGSPTFDLFIAGSPYDLALELPTAQRSLVEPATSPNALAVGAICWQTTGLEPYSSQGPTIDNRLKPDLTAPDSPSGATYGPFTGCGMSGFPGTSASAPHAAGAAALVKQRYPDFRAAELQKYLGDHAGDLGAAGADNEYGAGKLALPAIPPATVKAAPARGRFGRNVQLRFAVTAVEWETRTRIDVYRGAARIRSIDVPFAPAQAGSRSVTWRAPARPAKRSAFRFCVQTWDRADLASPRSCAPVTLT